MTMTSPTVAQIEAQITDRRECIALLDQEAQDLSLATVSGDQKAATALAAINAEVSQIIADVAVLERARLTAVQQQQNTSDAEIAAHRAHHREIAQDHAAVLVRLAGRVDDLVAEFKSVFAEMSATEKAVWDNLREARALPSPDVVGRRHLTQFAIASLNAFMGGKDKFGQTRAVADVAAKAWAELLHKNDDI
jgi:hypothetical protein